MYTSGLLVSLKHLAFTVICFSENSVGWYLGCLKRKKKKNLIPNPYTVLIKWKCLVIPVSMGNLLTQAELNVILIHICRSILKNQPDLMYRSGAHKSYCMSLIRLPLVVASLCLIRQRHIKAQCIKWKVFLKRDENSIYSITIFFWFY